MCIRDSVSTKSSTHTNKEKKDDGRVHTYKHVTHILLFLRSLFFSRSRRCKDEEMNNRFSLQREEIQLKTDGLPTLRETENSKTKTKKTFIVEKNTSAFFRGETTKKHERARKGAFTRLQNRATTRTTRARERERKRDETNRTNEDFVKKRRRRRRRHRARTRSRIFLRDEQPFKRSVPVPLEDVGEVFDRFFGGFVEP